ncbi:hypothetical protein B0H16DRAFT_1607041, partial [Mycena metata]
TSGARIVVISTAALSDSVACSCPPDVGVLAVDAWVVVSADEIKIAVLAGISFSSRSWYRARAASSACVACCLNKK